MFYRSKYSGKDQTSQHTGGALASNLDGFPSLMFIHDIAIIWAKQQKGVMAFPHNPFVCMVGTRGFEPRTSTVSG